MFKVSGDVYNLVESVEKGYYGRNMCKRAEYYCLKRRKRWWEVLGVVVEDNEDLKKRDKEEAGVRKEKTLGEKERCY